MAPYPDNSNLLDKKSTKIIHSIVGMMLYYSRSVDPTMLQAINEISRVQSKITRDTEEKTRMLLDYAATHPNSTICYKARNMVLHEDSYAAYLAMPEARSFYGALYLNPTPVSIYESPHSTKISLYTSDLLPCENYVASKNYVSTFT